MSELLPVIRNAVRALIIRQEKILLLRKEGGGRPLRFALPGGAQDTGETLADALNRECVEEIGTAVEIDGLIHVADFFKLRETDPPTRRHLVEFLFQCRVADDYQPHSGTHPDKHQVAVLWADLDELSRFPLYPQFLTDCILQHHAAAAATPYLGSFNDHPAP